MSNVLSHSTQRSRTPHLVAILTAVGLLGAAVWPGPSSSSSARNAAAFASAAVQSQTAAKGTVDGNRNSKPPDMRIVSGPIPSDPHTLVAPNPEPPAPNGSDSDPSRSTPAGAHPTEGPGNERYRTAILGTWTQDSDGHRVLDVQQNGTATIDVTLDGLSALAFGEKLRFDIEWTIEDDRLIFQTTGGEPKDGVKAVIAIYGASRNYVIRDITEAKMLLEEEGQPKTDWDRVGAAKISGSANRKK